MSESEVDTSRREHGEVSDFCMPIVEKANFGKLLNFKSVRLKA
jgi:hypothetical protein